MKLLGIGDFVYPTGLTWMLMIHHVILTTDSNNEYNETTYHMCAYLSTKYHFTAKVCIL